MRETYKIVSGKYQPAPTLYKGSVYVAKL